MKKLILIFTLIVTFNQLNAQATFSIDNERLFKQAKQNIKSVIRQSNYIVEGVQASENYAPMNCEYYYIPEENQSYYMVPIKIVSVFRGDNIFPGDTIIGIYKPYAKGKGDNWTRTSEDIIFRPWYYLQSTTCFFLSNNIYPIIPNTNLLSNYKPVNFIGSENDSFQALYIDENGKRRVSFETGLRFNSLKEWYHFLKTFPEIHNLPKQE